MKLLSCTLKMLAKSEIIALLNDVLGQTARLRKGGNEAVYFCPFCRHVKRKMECCLDENNKFFGVFNCWTCSTSGTFGKLLTLVNASQSRRDRLYQLTKDIRFLPKVGDKFESVELPTEFHPLSRPRNTPEYKNAVAYLRRRGVLREDILRYNIGYCEGGGEYEYHIIVPSYDAKSELNFFVGRRYYDTPGTIPYKKPNVPMSDIVGFESFVNYKEPLNIVEGCFDAFAVRNNAVPLFGKYLSRKLREMMLLNHTKRVNMILDNDALDDAVKNYVRLRRDGIEVYIVHLDGKDPSEMGFERTHELIRNAREFDEMELTK